MLNDWPEYLIYPQKSTLVIKKWQEMYLMGQVSSKSNKEEYN